MTTPAVSIDEIKVDFRRAEAARRSGDFRSALAGYLEILSRRVRDIRKSSDLNAADMVVLERTAELAILFGYDKGADNLLAGMASALESAKNFFAADYATLKRIHLALSFGRLFDARRLLRDMSSRIGDVESLSLTDAGLDNWETSCRWPDTKPQDRAVIFSRLYLNLGWLLASLGQYQDALLILTRGQRFTGESAPKLAQRAAIPLALTIATAQLELGNLDVAKEKLVELESFLDKRRQLGFYVRRLELDAKLKMLRGDFGGALFSYLEVVRCCEVGRFKRAELIAKLNLADALTFLNNVGIAQQFLLSVADQASQLKDDYIIARTKRQLAVAKERSASFTGTSAVAPSVPITNRTSETSESASGAAERFPEIPQSENYLSFFEDRTLNFYWQLGQLDLRLAAVIMDHLLAAFRTSDSKIVQIRLQVLQGTLAYYSGDLERAEPLLRDSLPALREMDLKPDLLQTQRILGWCWIRLGSPQSRYQQLNEDNQRLLSSMTASLPAAYQSVFLLNKWTAEEEFIAGEIGQLVALKNKIKAGSWFRRPLLQWSLKKRLYGLLAYVERYRDSLAKNNPADRQDDEKRTSLWNLIWNHPRDRSTVSFLVLPDRVLIVHAGWMTLDFDLAPVSRIQIRETVKQWHILVNRSAPSRGVAAPRKDDLIGDDFLESLITGERNLTPIERPDTADSVDEATALAEQLAHQLLLPSIIERLPQRVRALTIIAHDSLVGFPFAAITNEGKYLLEQFDLNVEVGFFNQKNTERRVVTTPKALFVGISKGGANFSALPGVLPEIHELEQWCQTRNLTYQTLMDEAATKPAIFEQLNDSTLLHIACHGVFRGDRPDASGLVLGSENGQLQIISLRELSAMNLTQLRHVSLSSCSSADN
ncbi:MAG TPA: CHAT domain-containing protein, partial [Pyrinomonadaceae bacterium]|nr:CHAT domain-containing protein [Pyrinomonadaceae bacterium]